MSAKEMFEKLGYDLDGENEWDLTYSKQKSGLKYYTSPITINFRKMNDNVVEKYDTNGKSVPILKEELQAINKQIEELGEKYE